MFEQISKDQFAFGETRFTTGPFFIMVKPIQADDKDFHAFGASHFTMGPKHKFTIRISS